MLTDNSHRLLNAKLEQKEYSKSCLSSTFTDPTYREHLKNHRQFIQKKLDELQRAENVQRIRVMVLVINFKEYFLFSLKILYFCRLITSDACS